MADVTITCGQCGNSITVSEFVTAESLTCVKCKSKVLIPPRRVNPAERSSKLRIAPQEPAPEPSMRPREAGLSVANDVQEYLPKALGRIRRRKVNRFQVTILPWLLFFLLASVLCGLRYWPQVLEPETLKTTIQAGVWALLFLHISVSCYAFTDEAFYGVLCLIIPGYSIYFLFVQSDKMVLRAVAGSLMIAFGWDAVLASQQLWAEVYTTVSVWIATTDTIKK